jgi:hypothetical protein
MKPPLTLFFRLTLFLFVAAGCSSSNRIVVGLQVQLTAITCTADGGADVSWRLSNPNIVPYLLAETTHRITLNGVLLGTLRNKAPVAIPAQAIIEGTAHLVPEGPAAAQAIKAALAAGSASYHTETDLLIRLYGETTDKGTLVGSGTVTVTAK